MAYNANIRDTIRNNRKAFKLVARHKLSFAVCDKWYEEVIEVVLNDKKHVVWERIFELINDTRSLYETLMVHEIINNKKGIYIGLPVIKDWSNSQIKLEKCIYLYHTNPLYPLPTLKSPLYYDEDPTKRKI